MRNFHRSRDVRHVAQQEGTNTLAAPRPGTSREGVGAAGARPRGASTAWPEHHRKLRAYARPRKRRLRRRGLMRPGAYAIAVPEDAPVPVLAAALAALIALGAAQQAADPGEFA